MLALTGEKYVFSDKEETRPLVSSVCSILPRVTGVTATAGSGGLRVRLETTIYRTNSPTAPRMNVFFFSIVNFRFCFFFSGFFSGFSVSTSISSTCFSSIVIFLPR